MIENDKKQFLIKFGNRIKQLRIAQSMSQDELAKKCGYNSRSTINKIELGINDIPQSKLKAIADALKVSPCDLLKIDEDIKIIHQLTLEEQIISTYGQTVYECITLYQQLDDGDQGEIRGVIKQMLKSEKYLTKKSDDKQAI